MPIYFLGGALLSCKPGSWDLAVDSSSRISIVTTPGDERPLRRVGDHRWCSVGQQIADLGLVPHGGLRRGAPRNRKPRLRSNSHSG